MSFSEDHLIEAQGIVRHFGHVRALQGADLSVGRGEIVGLIGDNGAGKSTLIRILSGTDRPDEGQIRVNGRLVHFNGPQDARAAGIETVYQDWLSHLTWTLLRTSFWGENFCGRVF